MQIPTGWTYFECRPGVESTTTAHLYVEAEDITLEVTHKTQDFTAFRVLEGDTRGWDFENRDRLVEWGAHRSPGDAFRFAAAYLADGGADFRPVRPRSVSDRYSRAVSAAY